MKNYLFVLATLVINLLVLAYLLKVARGRMAAAETCREKESAELFEKGRRLKDEAEREILRCRDMQKDLEKQRVKLLEKSRKEAETARVKASASLREEREACARAVRDHAAREVLSVARTVLKDLASLELEVRIVRVLLERLKRRDREQLKEMNRAKSLVVVRSAFPMPVDVQKRIIDEMKKYLNVENGVEFESVPELVSGIELRSGGKEISWNIDAYLGSLQDRKFEFPLRQEPGTIRAQKGERVTTGC